MHVLSDYLLLHTQLAMQERERREERTTGMSHSVVRRTRSTHNSAAQCSAVQCSAAQRSAVQRSAVQCSAVQCSAAQCSAAQRSAVQCSAVYGSAKVCA